MIVYVKEAHASDEWKLGNIVSIPQHKTILDRISAARKLVDDYNFEIDGGPVVCDSMENELNALYAIWPERYIVVDKDSKITHISQPDSEFGYDHRSLKWFVSAVCAESVKPNVMEP